MKIKEEIKKLSAEQVINKQQRKTVKLVGERTIEPYKALIQHKRNRYELFHLYLAYAKIRNREDRIKLKEGTDVNKTYVDKLVQQYGAEDVRPGKE